MWQHLPEKLNPIAFRLGPVEISWYGIMYVLAFALVYFLVRHRLRTEKSSISLETVRDFFPWGIAGLLLGARLGDVFIYDWEYFSAHPLEIFLPFDVQNHWQYVGIYGMSFFGGLVGLAIAFYFFSFLRSGLKNRFPPLNKGRYPKGGGVLEFSDLFAPTVPLALALGRLGNFINGELWGRTTNAPWGMYFPNDFSGQLRHPSQIYEMLLEGVLLFVILWSIRKIKLPVGYLTAYFLIGYGLARFAAEFFREPDNGWIFAHLTLGQWLCIAMIIFGIFLITKRGKTQRLAP
jgi:phosphatidylglycerol:prolipoprotein diacylglycerol transferase